MIQIRNISKSYQTAILKNISYDFKEGNIYLLKGVSGSGKSTLLNILGCIDTEYKGDYFLDGTSMKKVSLKKQSELRQKIGYIFQDSLLISHLTIAENLIFFCKDHAQIQNYVKMFDLTEMLPKFPSQLSNGQRQRVSIIRSLLNEHKVILADEPTASLDPTNAKFIAQLFTGIKNENKIIIIATHDNCFDKYADFIINLHYGEVKLDYELIDLENKKIPSKLKAKRFIKEDVKYSWKNFKSNNKVNVFFMTFVFSVILFSVGIQLHFASSYSDFIKNSYPCHVFNAQEALLDKMKMRDKVKIYPNYTIKVDELEIFGLFPKEDSSLNTPKALDEGRFPENDKEVIVNQKYKKTYFQNIDHSIIGEKIALPNFSEEFTICGILTKATDTLRDVYGSNANYRLTENSHVFVDQNLLSKHTHEIQNISGELVVSYPNLLENKIDYEQLQSRQMLFWENKINEKMYSINQFLSIFFICVLSILLISYLFLYNTISLDLFLRRREMGFLELLGLEWKRLFKILFFDYFLKIIIPIILSTVIFYALSFVILNVYEVRIYLSFIEYISILMFLLFYVFLLVALPFLKDRKVNIITKIKS